LFAIMLLLLGGRLEEKNISRARVLPVRSECMKSFPVRKI